MQWRKQGDEHWQSARFPLPGDEKHELVFVTNKYQNQFRCATCGKSLNETPYFRWRTVPHTIHALHTDKRYCQEHVPMAIEMQEGQTQTLGQHIVTAFKLITTLGQRMAALEMRVAELEARSNQGSPGQQSGDEES